MRNDVTLKLIIRQTYVNILYNMYKHNAILYRSLFLNVLANICRRECTNDQTNQVCLKRLDYSLKSFITELSFQFWKKKCCILRKTGQKSTRRGRVLDGRLYNLRRSLAKLIFIENTGKNRYNNIIEKN